MKNITTRQVQKTLARVREKYGVHGRAFTKKDFFRICKGEGIELIDPSILERATPAERANFRMPTMKGLGGFYAVKGGVRMIYLRCFWLKRFNRFVAFHELGHHFLRHQGSQILQAFRSDVKSDRKERDANAFAALAIKKVQDAKN